MPSFSDITDVSTVGDSFKTDRSRFTLFRVAPYGYDIIIRELNLRKLPDRLWESNQQPIERLRPMTIKTSAATETATATYVTQYVSRTTCGPEEYAGRDIMRARQRVGQITCGPDNMWPDNMWTRQRVSQTTCESDNVRVRQHAGQTTCGPDNLLVKQHRDQTTGSRRQKSNIERASYQLSIIQDDKGA